MSTFPTPGPLGPQFGASNETLNEATYTTYIIHNAYQNGKTASKYRTTE